MFERLGSLMVKRSKLVLITFVIAILAAGGIGSTVITKLDRDRKSTRLNSSH